MSYDKEARRNRRHNARKQVEAQLRLVRFYYPKGTEGYETKAKGRWRKQHALNCGRSGCCMCVNPRRIFKARTLHEQRIDQALKQALQALYTED